MRTAVALSVAAVAQAGTFKVGTIHDKSAPILGSVHAEEIPNSYIVKLKDHVDGSAALDHHAWIQDIHNGGEQERLELRKRGVSDAVFSGLKHTYSVGSSFRGYSGHFDDSVIELIRNHPDVGCPRLVRLVRPWHCGRVLTGSRSSMLSATPWCTP